MAKLQDLPTHLTFDQACIIPSVVVMNNERVIQFIGWISMLIVDVGQGVC
jgi:hypothetical protein